MRYWIIPSNSKKFRMEAALRANNGIIHWRCKNVSVGDIIFMYKTLPDGCTKYMMEVVETNIGPKDRINQDSFWQDMNKFNHDISIYTRLKLLKTLDEKALNIYALRNHGIKSNIQTKRACPPETLDFILRHQL